MPPKNNLPKKNSFMKAAQSMGYLQKGSFKPLPKKGTAEYNKIKARQAQY